MNPENRLYLYVYDMILNNIFNGRYPFQQKLPGIEKLCIDYQVGRNTIRSALNQLHEDGYISVKQGAQAVVIFNVRNNENNMSFRQYLLDSKDMIADINQTMIMIMPYISLYCLKQATPQQIKDIENKVAKLSIENVKNEQNQLEKLYYIYDSIFQILNNPLINSYINSMLNTLTLPLQIEDSIHLRLNLRMITLKRLISFTIKCFKKEKYNLFEKLVTTICQMNADKTEVYIKKISIGLTKQKEHNFIWSLDNEHDYLYVQTMDKMIQDFNKGTFTYDEVLPSIHSLATIYQVSERTVRFTLRLLNEYQIIETKNGVGSRLKIKANIVNTHLLREEKLIRELQDVADKVELLSIIVSSLLLDMKAKGDLRYKIKIFDDMQGQSYLKVLEALYQNVLRDATISIYTVYEELGRSLGWLEFIGTFLIDEDTTNCLKQEVTNLYNYIKDENLDGVIETLEDIVHKMLYTIRSWKIHEVMMDKSEFM